MANFVIAHLYPELMNLYSDRGNMICLQKRLEWLGYDCRIKNIGLKEQWDISEADMVFMGGGSLREQALVYDDLQDKKDMLWQGIEQGLPALFVCGAYQLLGRSYITKDGTESAGLNYFAFNTVTGPERLSGNIAVKIYDENKDERDAPIIVGFENHGGYTFFQDLDLKPWGKVVKGYGNNGKDGNEGIRYRNLVGTYLHGPLLPKNPAVADYFIDAMAERKGFAVRAGLDNSLEDYARDQVLKKIIKR